MYFLFAYPTLNGSFFRKKNILFKTTFVKRRGICDHSSQEGILPQKYHHLHHAVMRSFFKSQRYTVDHQTTCRYCSHHWKILTSIVFIRFDLEMQWLRNFHRSKYIEVSRLKKRKIRSWKKEMNRSWKPLLLGGFNHLKNVCQNGNLPQVGVKIKNIWNHHLACFFQVLC